MKKGVVEVSEGELLLEDVTWVFGVESRNEAVLGVCEDWKGEAPEADLLAEKRYVELKTLPCERDGTLQ